MPSWTRNVFVLDRLKHVGPRWTNKTGQEAKDNFGSEGNGMDNDNDSVYIKTYEKVGG
jgi:hypothetical protein